jgi:cell division protein FtsI (penicillin-binding protein 3)
MGLGLGAVVASAWRVQVEDGPGWRGIAERQRQRRLHIEPKRGTIYDRNHAPVALSVDVPSISADVVEMLRGSDGAAEENAKLHDAADRLARALSLDAAELYDRLATRHRFVWVKHRVTAAEAEAVRDLSDPRKPARSLRGVTIEGEGHRYYPGRELAGAVLGFVAPDGLGKDGIELALDTELRGTIGEVRGLRDRSGRLVFEGDSDERALQGDAVELSIDEGVQHIAEHELDGALHTYETKGGSLVVIEPETGEVLAMASSPGYNPNDYTARSRRASASLSV